MLTYFLVSSAVSLAYLSGLMHPEPAPPARATVPPANPRAVMEAFLDEIASQSRRRKEAKLMRQALSEYAVITSQTWAAIELPCYPAASRWRPRGADRRPTDGSPEESYWERVASVLADSYEVDYAVAPAGVVSLGKKRTYTMCVIVFYAKGSTPPKIEWQGRNFEATWELLRAQASAPRVSGGSGGGMISPMQIVNLIVTTVIQAGVGTVTTLGMAGLVRSMGGERRLARLMRRYKRTGSPRVKKKIVRTASRLKGRTVNWAEVEQILAEGAAS